MADISNYSQQSPEFAEMLKQGELGLDGGRAAFAVGNSYMYGSSRFCQDWYECFILKKTTQEQYDANLTLALKCVEMVRNSQPSE
jgi:hypothetical protein